MSIFSLISRVWNSNKNYLKIVLGLIVFLGTISTVIGDKTKSKALDKVKWIAIGSMGGIGAA